MNRLLIFLSIIISLSACNSGKIDRCALVTRHNIKHSATDSLSPLSVGNGKFAFTADITGMQTFPADYDNGIPLGTFSDWGWHSFENTGNYTLDDVERMYWNGADSVPYPYQFSLSAGERKYEATQSLRANPHRIHLGLIGLELNKQTGEEAKPEDIKLPTQYLNLWNGEMKSCFQFEGYPVEVTTLCHQENDQLAFRIKSPLIESGRIKIKLTFAYPRWEKFNNGCDFSKPDLHQTTVVNEDSTSIKINRSIDTVSYFVDAGWSGKASVTMTEKHKLVVSPETNDNTFEICVRFTPREEQNAVASFAETVNNNETNWEGFWKSGGAIDFSKCTDPRANELERRIVLSQYLTKIQNTGPYPPQETGLTYNSWHGKFHLEMHWWHLLHFIAWNRSELIEKQLDYYFNIFDKAKGIAELQGYEGVRWPKMTCPSGDESPSFVGPFLIWQQPHIIYFTNLMYRAAENDLSVLQKYYPLVEATADFMASYARWDSTSSRYVLGKALIPAQERFSPQTTLNPAFELAYWYWALNKAQEFRLKIGKIENSKWQHVIDNLSQIPVKDSLYLFTEDAVDSYENPRYLTDHPIVLAIGGFLPLNERTDTILFKKTFDTVLEKWDWHTCWGWDFPLAALAATVLNEPEQAIDLLLMDTQKNTYLVNGHNYQEGRLPLYLPGNGGLLSAVAEMCTYRNDEGKNGFPLNGEWDVKYENLNSLY